MGLLLCFVLPYISHGQEISKAVASESFGGYNMPEAINDNLKTGITNYGKIYKDPSLGIGIGYRGKKSKIDIYIYDTIKPEWKNLSVTEKIKREIDYVDDIFKSMVEAKAYSNYKKLKVDSIEAGGRKYSRVLLEYTEPENNITYTSDYYLAPLDGKVLKIRISEEKGKDRKSAESAFGQIAKIFTRK